MQLYYSPGACSLAVTMALERTRAHYESIAVPLREGAQLKAEYLAVNPRARVPALVVDGQVLTEVVAILAYLDERYPQAGLLPRGDIWRRAKAWEWLMYLASTVHPLYRAYWKPSWFSDEEAVHAALSVGADKRLVQLFAELDAALADRPFLLGDAPTAVDYYALVFARWGSVLSVPTSKHPRLAAWQKRAVALPEVQRAAEREAIDPLRRAA